MAEEQKPALFVADESAALNARLTENLEVLALAINGLSNRLTALDAFVREGTATDHNAELLGKALQYLAGPK